MTVDVLTCSTITVDPELRRVLTSTLTPLTVSLARADALLARLDAEFEASSERRFNAEYGMEFARHPARFWLFHTCADEVAEWLEELDCDVSWSPIRTRLSVPDD